MNGEGDVIAHDAILVTGANRGIGLALVRRLLDDGCRVIATCREPVSADALATLASRVPDDRLEVLPLDVGDEASVAALCRALDGRALDVVVNNAGRMRREDGIEDLDLDDWAATFAINSIAPLRVARALKPNLARAARPRLVTVSSQMGSLERAGTGSIAYRSSKAAVNMAMRALAAEWRADGIAVVVVHPGWVRTDMGGQEAALVPDDSAAGLARLIARLRPEDTDRFLNHDGAVMPW